MASCTASSSATLASQRAAEVSGTTSKDESTGNSKENLRGKPQEKATVKDILEKVHTLPRPRPLRMVQTNLARTTRCFPTAENRRAKAPEKGTAKDTATGTAKEKAKASPTLLALPFGRTTIIAPTIRNRFNLPQRIRTTLLPTQLKMSISAHGRTTLSHSSHTWPCR